MTGTPIENNIIELWSVFDFIMPDFSAFISSTNDLQTETKMSQNLRAMTSPFIIRRIKSDVLEELRKRSLPRWLMTKNKRIVYGLSDLGKTANIKHEDINQKRFSILSTLLIKADLLPPSMMITTKEAAARLERNEAVNRRSPATVCWYSLNYIHADILKKSWINKDLRISI